MPSAADITKLGYGKRHDYSRNRNPQDASEDDGAWEDEEEELEQKKQKTTGEERDLSTGTVSKLKTELMFNGKGKTSVHDSFIPNVDRGCTSKTSQKNETEHNKEKTGEKDTTAEPQQPNFHDIHPMDHDKKTHDTKDNVSPRTQSKAHRNKVKHDL